MPSLLGEGPLHLARASVLIQTRRAVLKQPEQPGLGAERVSVPGAAQQLESDDVAGEDAPRADLLVEPSRQCLVRLDLAPHSGVGKVRPVQSGQRLRNPLGWDTHFDSGPGISPERMNGPSTPPRGRHR